VEVVDDVKQGPKESVDRILDDAVEVQALGVGVLSARCECHFAAVGVQAGGG
jgi:hypothetical protein